MQTFTFTAKNAQTGEQVQSELQADSEAGAAKLLTERNLTPISIAAKGEPKAGEFNLNFLKNRISAKDKIILTRQLATLVNAGLPIMQSLRSAMEQVNSAALKVIVEQVGRDVEGGSSLSAALAKHPKVFNSTYVSIVAAGEASGSLDKTLDRLAKQMEKDAEVLGKFRGALVYPAIVMLVVVGVVTFLLAVVMPQIGQVYKDFNKPLPAITQFLLTISHIITGFWWVVLILLGAGFYGGRSYVRTTYGKLQFDQLKLKVPFLKILIQKVYMARFARTLATLLASGVPVLNALNIVKGTINNDVVSAEIEDVTSEVRGGRSLSQSLLTKPSFMKIVPQMIKIGEDSGSIDASLEKLATYLEEEIDTTVKNLSVTIEPILMVVMGVIVGSILGAVLIPIYGLVSTGGAG